MMKSSELSLKQTTSKAHRGCTKAVDIEMSLLTLLVDLKNYAHFVWSFQGENFDLNLCNNLMSLANKWQRSKRIKHLMAILYAYNLEMTAGA